VHFVTSLCNIEMKIVCISRGCYAGFAKMCAYREDVMQVLQKCVHIERMLCRFCTGCGVVLFLLKKVRPLPDFILKFNFITKASTNVNQ
jgi:hypothetical protein